MATFEELKRRADDLNRKSEQAKGALKNIKENWMQTYGTDDPVKIKAILEDLKQQEIAVESEITAKMKELAEQLCVNA